MNKTSLDTFVSGEDKVIHCKKCGNQVRAGGKWVLFCPHCKVSEENYLVSHTMSCTHCDIPLTIMLSEKEEQKGTFYAYGRCHNPKCGDCYSMQDLTLIPLDKKIGHEQYISPLEKILNQFPEKDEPISQERLPKDRSLFQFSVVPVAPTCGYIPSTDRGHKTPRRPSLDQLDRFS